MEKNKEKEFIRGIFNFSDIQLNLNNRSDGSKYEGEWSDNKICGKGKYSWADVYIFFIFYSYSIHIYRVDAMMENG